MPANTSNYDDGPGEGAAPAPQEQPQPDDGDAAKTAILPKSLFGKELKPGDKCDIEVVAVHEQDYEIRGCEGGNEDAPPPDDEGGEPAAPDAPGSMSSMLSD